MSPPDERTVLEKAQSRLSSLASTLTPFSVAETGYTFPRLDDLPNITGQPQGCLWGFFDKHGVKDELGTLNLLTPPIVHAAAREVHTGKRVQLDRLFENGRASAFGGRKPFEQKMIDHSQNSRLFGFDDEVTFNTQTSSQWDGLKHFAHQASQMYYNGLSHEEALTGHTNGIHRWGEAGGIVGRGVLVDWARWYEHHHGNPPLPNSRHEIAASEIQETLKYQNTATRPGDVLIIRSGYGRWVDAVTAEERAANPKAIGLQGSEATVRWLYDQHFAAVAGDTVAFEAWPPVTSRRKGWCLHEWLLVQWGTPIGELWELEKLGSMCEEEKRWTFFLTSAPLRVRGGIGSPPGVIAIF